MESNITTEPTGRKPKRIRLRHHFTLSEETMRTLEEVARLQDVGCMSRAVDEIVRFYAAALGITLQLNSANREAAHE